MKRRMVLFAALTLVGTGAAFALSNGSAAKTADKAFCSGSCPPECCTVNPPAGCDPGGCCYDPGCCAD